MYPPPDLVFNAFRLTAYEDVRVVILGQDPYHGPGHVDGRDGNDDGASLDCTGGLCRLDVMGGIQLAADGLHARALLTLQGGTERGDLGTEVRDGVEGCPPPA